MQPDPLLTEKLGTGNYIFCVNNTALGNLSAYKAFYVWDS